VAERARQGRVRGDELFGDGFPDQLAEGMERWSPGFGDFCMGFIYGGMYERSVLDQKTRELLAVAACVVQNAIPQLDTHTRAAIRMGATREEVFEVALQMSIHVGMPYMLQAARRIEGLLAS
jgi:4-carboxymuconolactone decarboxylase